MNVSCESLLMNGRKKNRYPGLPAIVRNGVRIGCFPAFSSPLVLVIAVNKASAYFVFNSVSHAFEKGEISKLQVKSSPSLHSHGLFAFSSFLILHDILVCNWDKLHQILSSYFFFFFG